MLTPWNFLGGAFYGNSAQVFSALHKTSPNLSKPQSHINMATCLLQEFFKLLFYIEK